MDKVRLSRRRLLQSALAATELVIAEPFERTVWALDRTMTSHSEFYHLHVPYGTLNGTIHFPASPQEELKDLSVALRGVGLAFQDMAFEVERTVQGLYRVRQLTNAFARSGEFQQHVAFEEMTPSAWITAAEASKQLGVEIAEISSSTASGESYDRY